MESEKRSRKWQTIRKEHENENKQEGRYGTGTVQAVPSVSSVPSVWGMGVPAPPSSLHCQDRLRGHPWIRNVYWE